jgi:hypothetical protein
VRTVGADAAVVAAMHRLAPKTLARIGSRIQAKLSAI